MFMTPDPYGMDRALTLADAADRMRAYEVRHLLVLDGSKLIGVVQASDLTLASLLAGDNAPDTPVEAAARPVFACSPDVPVSLIAATMEARHLDCAVVVNGDREVIGIFTLTDALRALRQLAAGHRVEPLRQPNRERASASESEQALPHVRVKRMLRTHGASPRAADGLAFGKVFN
jgi:predicted transcriptional regulator